MRATLYVDESGTFGDMNADPRSDLRLIAGLLLPGDGSYVRRLLGEVADAAGESVPLHAFEMTDNQRTKALDALTAALPREARVLVILDRGPGGQEHYGSVLAAFVRLGFAQLQQALDQPSTIGWISAQRKKTFSRPELARHILATCASLSRGGPPIEPGRVDVQVAESNPGLQLADLVANHLRRNIKRGLRSVVPPDRLHIGSTWGAAGIAALYAAMDAAVPSLLDAADLSIQLARGQPAQDPWAAAAREVEAVGGRLLVSIMRSASQRGAASKAAIRLLHETRWRLAAKVGDYEAAALAFETWASDASATRLPYDPDLLFSLYAAQAEIANHRGEVRLDWIDAAWRQLESTRNLETLVRRFHLSNLEMVCLQNQLLIDRGALEALSVAGERARASLSSYAALVDTLAGDDAAGEVRPVDPVLAAAGRRPTKDRIDHVYGALLGTLGRTVGFVGRPHEAIDLLLNARERFGTELDLERNGLSLAHAALQAVIDEDNAEKAWDLVVAVLDRHLSDRRPEAFQDVGAHRFRLQLLLKAAEVAWPRAIEGFDRDGWLRALHPDGALHAATLAAEGHPIELIGRHAALWLGKVKAPRPVVSAWWAIATRGWASGDLPAVRAIKEHSARMSKGASPEGPRGCATHPVFEYR